MKTIATKRHKRLIELLKAERRARSLKQDGVAHAMRRPQAWVWRLESGDRRVDVVEFLTLAEVIGFDPYALLRQIQAIPLEKAPRAIPKRSPRARKRK